MKTRTKYSLILVVFFIFAWLWKNILPKEKPDEIVVDGIHIPRKPCITVMNELYGAGIDSSKICDCLVPRFYEFIKKDSSQVAKFKDVGIFALDYEDNERFMPVFDDCMKNSLIDSSFKLQLTGVYLTGFKRKLLELFVAKNMFNGYNKELLSNCVIDKVNNNITLGEYLTSDYSENNKVLVLIEECLKEMQK